MNGYSLDFLRDNKVNGIFCEIVRQNDDGDRFACCQCEGVGKLDSFAAVFITDHNPSVGFAFSSAEGIVTVFRSREGSGFALVIRSNSVVTNNKLDGRSNKFAYHNSRSESSAVAGGKGELGRHHRGRSRNDVTVCNRLHTAVNNEVGDGGIPFNLIIANNVAFHNGRAVCRDFNVGSHTFGKLNGYRFGFFGRRVFRGAAAVFGRAVTRNIFGRRIVGDFGRAVVARNVFDFFADGEYERNSAHIIFHCEEVDDFTFCKFKGVFAASRAVDYVYPSTIIAPVTNNPKVNENTGFCF